MEDLKMEFKKAYRVNDEGWFEIKKNKNGKYGVYMITPTSKGENLSILVSSLIFIKYKVYAKNKQYFLVCWDNGRELKERYIAQSDLFGEKLSSRDDEGFNFIVNNGLIISPKCKSLLIEYFKSSSEIAGFVDGVEKAGWDLKTNHFYSSGLTTDTEKKFVGNSAFVFESNGNEDEYKERIGAVFEENPLVFAIAGYSASAFFLPYLNNEINQIIQLNGETSAGKSSLLLLCSSLFTYPRYDTLNATMGSLLGMLKAYNHHPIFFDEVGESELRVEDARRLVYSIANGTEKSRLKSNDAINDYEPTAIKNKDDPLKYTVVIAGERSFLDSSSKDGSGLGVRYVEIVIPPNLKLWESITSSSELEDLIEFIKSNYGFLSEYLINYIKDNHKEIKIEYKQILEEERAILGESTRLLHRKVRIIAYTKLSLKLIANYIYDDEEVANSVVENAYMAFRNAITYEFQKPKENKYKQKLAHIHSHLFKYLEDENSIDDNQVSLTQKYGSFKNTTLHREIFIIPSKFSDVCAKLEIDERLFMQYLKDNNLLVTDKGEYTKKLKKLGDINRVRYYYIKIPVAFFEDEDDKNENGIETETVKEVKPVEEVKAKEIKPLNIQNNEIPDEFLTSETQKKKNEMLNLPVELLKDVNSHKPSWIK